MTSLLCMNETNCPVRPTEVQFTNQRTSHFSNQDALDGAVDSSELSSNVVIYTAPPPPPQSNKSDCALYSFVITRPQ